MNGNGLAPSQLIDPCFYQHFSNIGFLFICWTSGCANAPCSRRALQLSACSRLSRHHLSKYVLRSTCIYPACTDLSPAYLSIYTTRNWLRRYLQFIQLWRLWKYPMQTKLATMPHESRHDVCVLELYRHVYVNVCSCTHALYVHVHVHLIMVLLREIYRSCCTPHRVLLSYV